MLWNVSEVKGYGIEAADGAIGSIVDFLFDDQTSAIRYVVVDTGDWLPGKKVLLAPAAFGGLDPELRSLSTGLRRHQIETSPELASDQPVSRRHEEALHRHYDWAPYWAAPETATLAPYWGLAGYGHPLTDPEAGREAFGERQEPEVPPGDPHLRSAGEVIGYHIAASDGEIGHVEDLLVEDATWTLRYIVVDTRNWLPGRKVIVSPEWLRWIDWAERKLRLDLDKESIRSSPEYDPRWPPDRRLEERLHAHYGRRAYWGLGT